MSVYGFSEKDHRRVSDTVRRVENSALGRLGTAKGPRISSDPIRRGITQSDITARSVGAAPWTPGSGSVAFYDYDASENRVTVGDGQTVLNDWAATASSGVEAVCYWRGGKWWLLGNECDS